MALRKEVTTTYKNGDNKFGKLYIEEWLAP